MNICTEKVDRISALPDKLLYDILALLSTKVAVATSVLSKRWQYVWAGVHVLDFFNYPAPTEVAPFDISQYVRYKNFVNRVLLLNNTSCLERVHWQCHDGFSPLNVYEWMLLVANRCIKELCLLTSCRQSSIKLPSTLLLHKDNLVNLTLGGKLELCLPSSIHLPQLKRLWLISVLFGDADDPFSIFSSSCPALENLTVAYCQGYGKISVCSSSLRILEILSNGGVGQSITIKTPKLQHLRLSMSIVQSSITISELSSLVTAELKVATSAVRWVKILQSLCSVRTLILEQLILDDSNIINQLPKLHNLTELRVLSFPWSSVVQLLRNAPNLATLIVNQVKFDWPENMLTIAELALKRIECYSNNIGEEHLEVLRVLLSNSKLLNELKVNVRYWKSPKSEIRTLKRLLEFPRASTTCRISVISADDNDDDGDD